jgi:hypothetical protein
MVLLTFYIKVWGFNWEMIVAWWLLWIYGYLMVVFACFYVPSLRRWSPMTHFLGLKQRPAVVYWKKCQYIRNRSQTSKIPILDLFVVLVHRPDFRNRVRAAAWQEAQGKHGRHGFTRRCAAVGSASRGRRRVASGQKRTNGSPKPSCYALASWNPSRWAMKRGEGLF